MSQASITQSLSSYQDAFARHGFQQGLPLWNPEPVSLPQDRRAKGLKIGDVGIIDRDGYFQAIFNICNPPDHALERRYGFPSDFKRLEEPNILEYNVFPPGHVFSSPETSWYSTPVETSHYTDPWTVNASHVMTTYSTHLSEDGAHILVPHGAVCSKLALEDYYLFESQASSHWYTWFDFVRSKLRGRLNTLNLITGLSRTRSWALASFNKKGDREIEVTCNLAEREGKLLVSSSRWMPAGRFSSGIGPRVGDQEHDNQTIFIQTFTITSNGVAEAPSQEQLVQFSELVGTHSNESMNRESTARPSNQAGFVQHDIGSSGNTDTGGAVALEDNVTMRHVPEVAPPFHPSEIINQHLLTKKPSAKVAVTHDNVWISMIAEGQLSKLCDLESNINTMLSNNCSILSRDGVVYLRDKEVPTASVPRLMGAGTATNDVLSWTNQDPREGQLFNAWGVLYRFVTVVNISGQSTTTLFRIVRANKEDRIAKLDWASNGGLGRAMMNKNVVPMSDLIRPDPFLPEARIFSAPDGLQYRWRPAFNTPDVLLEDSAGNVVAFYRPTRPTRYQIGDVYGELHFLRNAGAGTITSPPMMDMVTVTAMLYRFCEAFGL